MNYYSLPFLLFFLFVFTLYWGVRRWSLPGKLVLLGASYVFYASWDPAFLLALLGFSLCMVGIGQALRVSTSPGWRRFWLGFGVVGSVGNLMLFKYYHVLREQMEWLVGQWGYGLLLPPVDILLPVGISFFTFQGLSYLIDEYRGQLPGRPTPLEILLFLAFFPSLLAGPIARAQRMLPQIRQNGSGAILNLDYALVLIALGLFKKLVLSTYLATELVDPVHAFPEAADGSASLLAMYGYTLQIYCDFSGYTDLTIGIALLLGYVLPPNFDAPYAATSLREFWRRWHMSLSSWIRDYVYIPLGGSRRGRGRTIFAVLVAMLVSGFWHGATLNYLIWGGLHGLGVVVVLLWQPVGQSLSSRCGVWVRRGGQVLAWALTFHFVVATWVFFRAATLPDALSLFASLQRWTVAPAGIAWGAAAVIAAALLIQFDRGWLRNRGIGLLRASPMPLKAMLFTLWVYLVLQLSPEGVPPFIYFKY